MSSAAKCISANHPANRYRNRYQRRISYRCQCPGKGTSNGCITDVDGNFTLTVSPKATMVISYVGYVTQEIPLNGQKNIKIALKDDSEMLDEVVVVGYGTMKKSDMTGAISSVKAEDLMKRATTSTTEALQGKIAGVSV